MYFWGAPGLLELFLAAVVAAVLGYLVAWLFEKVLIKRISDDRVAGIALSFALVFIVMMGSATALLTLTDPFEDGPIVIPPLGYALSFLVGLAIAGAVRMQVYSRQYALNDDQDYFEPDYNDLSRYDQEVLAFDERNAGRNYFRRHWAGHLPLPLSYWVNSALLSSLILAALAYAASWMARADYSLRSLSGMAFAGLLLSLILWVWSSVGVWRSAYWHRRRGGSPAWGVAARVLVFLSALTTIFGSKDLALQAAELGQLALGRDSMGEVADMRVSDDGRSIVVRGNIAQGASERFRTILNRAPKAEEVVLTSPGGRTLEAERMARMIGERKLNTRVDDHCMSACTYLLLAGDLRSAPHSARVGFHQPSFPGLSSQDMRLATGRMHETYLKAGVDPTFASRAMLTPAEGMWFPSWDELVDANVLTQPEIVIGGSKSEKARRGKIEIDSLTGRRLSEELAAAASQINAKGPQRLDDITRLERAKASGLVLTHYYTLNAPRLDIPQARRAMAGIMRGDVCAEPAYAAAVHDGAEFRFSYSSRAGRHLFDVSVTDCG